MGDLGVTCERYNNHLYYKVVGGSVNDLALPPSVHGIISLPP
jgi:hypothetical protein